MRFRVVAGKHTQKEQIATDASGKPVFGPVTYKKGQVLDAKTDLIARFNSPGCVKFEMVAEDTPKDIPVITKSGTPISVAPVAKTVDAPKVGLKPEFDHMNVKELLAYAADEEIDVKGSTRKEELIHLLKTAKK